MASPKTQLFSDGLVVGWIRRCAWRAPPDGLQHPRRTFLIVLGEDALKVVGNLQIQLCWFADEIVR